MSFDPMQRVLVVEDDAPTRRMLSAVLARHASVDICADEGDAVALLGTGRYDVVVLALVSQNPEADTSILRLLAEQSKPPRVILISAGSPAKMNATASSLICARLMKPFVIEDLVDAIGRCFRARE